MTFMTRRSEELLDKLIALAGSASLVEVALRQLTSEKSNAPTIEELVARIIHLRDEPEDADSSVILQHAET